MLHQASPINQRTTVQKTGQYNRRSPAKEKKFAQRRKKGRPSTMNFAVPCNAAPYKHASKKGPTLHHTERVLPYYTLILHPNCVLRNCPQQLPQQYWSKNAIMVFSTSSRESLSLWISCRWPVYSFTVTSWPVSIRRLAMLYTPSP